MNSGPTVVKDEQDGHLAIVITTREVTEVEGWPEKAAVSPAALLADGVETYFAFHAHNGHAIYQLEGINDRGVLLLRKATA